MTAFRRRVPHVHDGEPDAVIRSACGPNMLRNPTPGQTGGASNWVGVNMGEDGSTRTLEGFDASADSLYQIILTAELRAQYGTNGAPMVLSFFAKPETTYPSQGEMYFGIADGQAGGNPGTGDYATGHQWTVDYTDFVSGDVWTRFWAWSDDSSPASAWPGAGASTDLRFLLVGGSTAFDQIVQVTGFQVNNCATAWLPPFNTGPQETQIRKYGHGSGQGGSGSNTCKAPVWDSTVAITDAVKITVRT